MPALDEFEDEIDREHARLDMHKVNDGTMLMGLWWAKWGAKVETFLDEAPGEIDRDEVEELRTSLREAESDANSEEERADKLKRAIETAVEAFDALDDERITDAIADIVSNLENAL